MLLTESVLFSLSFYVLQTQFKSTQRNRNTQDIGAVTRIILHPGQSTQDTYTQSAHYSANNVDVTTNNRLIIFLKYLSNVHVYKASGKVLLID